ncbi:MAG: hypothetical protein QXN08_08865 [Nitrososphaerales archaeon]
MGTRSLIKIFDIDGKEICTIYTQNDGYPKGWMLDIVRFLSKRKLVNGFRYYDEINGMDDLATQVITFLKLKYYEILKKFIRKKEDMYFRNKVRDKIHKMILAGGIYLMPPGSRGFDEEWIYHIKPNDKYVKDMKSDKFTVEGGIIIEVYKVDGTDVKLVWKGTPTAYVNTFSQ